MPPSKAMNVTSSNQELTLDLTTLVQLSQAMAAEIVLSRLLPTLIQIFMENTGAHIGFLVMDKAGEWVIETGGELHSTEIRTTSLLQSIPIVHHLPHSIINYVVVKQTSVNLNNATQTGEFTTDPYIQAHQSQSILCVPLVYDRQLKGIVYLENQQSGHFSAYHLALIEILSGQAAIAITNAQVYTQVKERESQLAQLLDGLPVGVAMHDTTGKMIYANSVAMQIAGDESVREATSEEISQAYKLYRAGTQAPYPTSQLPVVRALAGETLTIDDMELYQGDRVISLEVVSTPIYNAQGQIVNALCAVRDITERKQAEIALRESEERFRQLAENIDAVLWIAAKGHFQILYVSHAYTRIWGRNAQDLYDNPHSFFDAIYPEDLEKVRAIVPVTNHNYDVEYRIVRPDGEMRWLRDRSFPIRNAQGEIYRYGGIAEDITEKKQIEAQFLRAQRLESVGTLASGIAHNLNNILSPILLSLELLERKLPDQKSQQLLKMLESNVKRGSALVKQVLSFSRGVSGKHMIINIKHIVSEIQYIIQETFPKSIKLSTNLAPDLWNVCADSNQLHQVLMNLCINARDAMPHGGSLSIYATNLFIDQTSARKYLDAQVGEYVMLSVADTGSGIAPEILERIFEPFFTTKEVGQGTGLGLSTVIGIIKHHSGFVNVESTLGKGSQFQVYLPAVTDEQQQPVREIELPQGQGELILLVDDEKSIRETAKILLSNYNYKVLTANNGIEAIALYVEHKAEISLVFIDMTMPDMDGLTTIRTLHRINPHLKVIASSGLPSNETIAEMSSLGVKAFLSKPYTIPELLKTLSLVL